MNIEHRPHLEYHGKISHEGRMDLSSQSWQSLVDLRGTKQRLLRNWTREKKSPFLIGGEPLRRRKKNWQTESSV